MSLRTRLRISIVALVAVIVTGLSGLYVYDFTALAFEAATTRADLIAKQVNDYLLDQIKEQTASLPLKPTSLAEYKAVWTQIIRTDPLLQKMLERTFANADAVVDINISDQAGATLVSASPQAGGSRLPVSRDLGALRNRNAFRNLWDLRNPEDYVRSLPVGVAAEREPLFRVNVVIRSALLVATLDEPFRKLAAAFFLTLAISVVLALLLASVVVGAIQRLGRKVDAISTGEHEENAAPARQETRELAAVQSKLNLLGQQFRGAKQDAQELRSNVQSMLQSLDEAVLLFDSSECLTVAGHPAERMLGRSSAELMGRKVADVFPASTLLGRTIHAAIEQRRPLRDEAITLERNSSESNGTGRLRVLLNLEILGGDGGDKGTLITIRDADTRRQLALQLDVATRLAAISRLTGGVAHEIKNPLNAMAVHLEVLKSKLETDDPEIDVISKEIRRLDRVVKTFLSFNKPLDVQVQPLDLSLLATEVVALIQPEARLKNVSIITSLAIPHWINGDVDLLKQVLLNLVMNAIEAMEGGGSLSLRTEEAGSECSIEISDTGIGIPHEIQDKIYNLYFSTKSTGSGIGLAMVFRVVQLHGGTINLHSESGKGTSFNLLFPSVSASDSDLVFRQAHS